MTVGYDGHYSSFRIGYVKPEPLDINEGEDRLAYN